MNSGFHEDVNQPVEIDTSVPHSARVYDYWLGGKDNYPADQALGDAIAAILMLVAEADDPYRNVAVLLDALPSGSQVVISHPTGDFDAEAMAGVVAASARAGLTFVPRDRAGGGEILPRARTSRARDGAGAAVASSTVAAGERLAERILLGGRRSQAMSGRTDFCYSSSNIRVLPRVFGLT